MDQYYMQIAIKEAHKALKHNEVPVGAVIVKEGKIIAKAYNKREKTHDVTKHAEMIIISQACKKLKNWRLEGCTLYVTMEPCMMCCGAIEQSRISKIVYGTRNENFGNIDKINIKNISQSCEEECKKLICDFFKNKR